MEDLESRNRVAYRLRLGTAVHDKSVLVSCVAACMVNLFIGAHVCFVSAISVLRYVVLIARKALPHCVSEEWGWASSHGAPGSTRCRSSRVHYALCPDLLTAANKEDLSPKLTKCAVSPVFVSCHKFST